MVKTLHHTIIMVLILASCLWADDSVKQLEAKIDTFSGRAKLDALNQLVKAYWGSAPLKSVSYGKMALQQAELSGDAKDVAEALNNIGVAFKNMGDYEQAMDYYLNALKIRETLSDRKEIANSLHNVGVLYDYLLNYEKALEYYHQALTIREEIGDKKGIASSYNNIGIIHHFSEEYQKALDYYHRALNLRKQIEDKKGVGSSMNNSGAAYRALGNHKEALSYFLKAINIFKELNDTYEVANISNNIGELYLELEQYPKAEEYLKLGLSLGKKIGAKELIRESYEFFSRLHVADKDYQKALEYFKLSADVKDMIFTEENSRKIADMETKYEMEKKEKEIELLKKDNDIQQLEVGKQKLLRNSFLVGLTLVMVLALVLYNRFRLKKKAHSELETAHSIIKEEKDKSDKLLLNILPVRVAENLKESGKTEPESFDNVTVYFSDIVGFTKLSSTLEPNYLINELNDIFTEFDYIVEKNNCERIKTIGDAYLCVSGMPKEDPNHADNIIQSSIEIIQYLEERNRHSKIQWTIRVGIHSGKVVGGVVGIKKYIYDVFGDTINTASRMESNSSPMKINLSEVTWQIVKDRYKCIERESLNVKGKGEMKMFFLDMEKDS
ncbi:adenylate/guanylate cyclase domain-containing protein [Desulfobacterales bacterium HSG16]|nr:adenylate/guanylate cyclase domain-containing protein [Desulfobacterales bacterium HSG16]